MPQGSESFADYCRTDQEMTSWMFNKASPVIHPKPTQPSWRINVAYVIAQMAKNDPMAKAKFGLSDRDFSKFCWQVLHGKRRTAFKNEVLRQYTKMKMKGEI
jgi:hypothetical protein